MTSDWPWRQFLKILWKIWGGSKNANFFENFGVIICFPFLHFFGKNADQNRKQTKVRFLYARWRDKGATHTRQCAGLAWRGVSSCWRQFRHRALFFWVCVSDCSWAGTGLNPTINSQKWSKNIFFQKCPKSISLDSGHLDKPFGPLIFQVFQYFGYVFPGRSEAVFSGRQ